MMSLRSSILFILKNPTSNLEWLFLFSLQGQIPYGPEAVFMFDVHLSFISFLNTIRCSTLVFYSTFDVGRSMFNVRFL
jgi:hypothetical protein